MDMPFCHVEAQFEDDSACSVYMDINININTYMYIHVSIYIFIYKYIYIHIHIYLDRYMDGWIMDR